MAMENLGLNKGEEILLDIGDSARRRIVCGLCWDPMSGEAVPVDKTTSQRTGATDVFDLDLLCLVYDKYGRFMAAVTGDEGHRTGDSGNIYHTGDVVDGEDTLDDEQISLELFNLSSKIDQIIFIAEVQSQHDFKGVANPEIRIANAIDDRNMAHADLSQADEGEDSYVFGRLFRGPKGWMFEFIGDYFNSDDIQDWTESAARYVKKAAPVASAGGSTGMSIPSKGETVPLFYSRQARHRVIVGLNWDPAEDPAAESVDMDLACVIYNEAKEPIDGVSAKPEEAIDESGRIYHSGDDTGGEGDKTDDEAISVELKDMPDHIHHIVFLAEIQSNHVFKTILNPTLRVADAKTHDEQLLVSMDGPDAASKTACIFARISRRGEAWTLTNINEYVKGEAVEDWIGFLQRYVG